MISKLHIVTVLVLMIAVSPSVLQADTFTVTNTNDDGPGSLRNAINIANVSAGLDEIHFDIPGTGPHTIRPESLLPEITDPVVIDGYTQPGATPNTNPTGLGLNTVMMIELAGENVHDVLVISAGDSRIRGLVINESQHTGIVLKTNGNNVIEGNFIGTGTEGWRRRGNVSHGVRIESDGNTIGGTTPEARNLISGNLREGLVMGGSDNHVLGNLIGTSVAGSGRMSNGYGGISVDGGNNVFGGTVPGARNVISGNEGSGILLNSATGNQILGNYIGLDVSGTVAVGNHYGLTTLGAGTLIGDNVISGNEASGIRIPSYTGTPIVVEGNYIGTDATGMVAVANGREGVDLWGNHIGTIVGGTTPDKRNVISGNGANGVWIRKGATVTLLGNYIGIDASGNGGLGNSKNGVFIDWGTGNAIGVAGAGNVISGNSLNGVVITGYDTSDNTLHGNFIGTNAAGTFAIPNASNGVVIGVGAKYNSVGGSWPDKEGNVISGNGGYGVFVENEHSNVLSGNHIGTDFKGTAAVGNGSGGVSVEGGGRLWIGYTYLIPSAFGDSHRNVISGNNGDGIRVASSSSIISGNYIGTDASGTAPLGNTGNGVWVSGNYNRVGYEGGFEIEDPDPPVGNTIAFNGGDGVEINAGFDNSIVFNTIFSNALLGIRNSSDDGTQNYPVITRARTGVDVGNNISGTVESSPNTEVVVQVFANVSCDASGYGEGERLVGGVTLTTDGSGFGTFSVTPSAPINDDEFATATATALGGGSGYGITSEFSKCYRVGFGVTNTNDSGVGSLRFAISDAGRFRPAIGTAFVYFNIPGPGPHVIQPLTDLPNVFRDIVIDGFTQSGAFPNTNGPGLSSNAVMKIEIDGSNARFGLRIIGPRDVVRGLVINGCSDEELLLQSNGECIVEGNYFGTDVDGASNVGHSVGIYVGSSDNTVGGTANAARNVIVGEVNFGPTANNNIVQGNYIGTDAGGTVALGDQAKGNYIGGSNNIFGGTSAAARNVMVGRVSLGTGANDNVIQGNYIGVDITGTASLGNPLFGIIVSGARNTIGGVAPGARNIISGNGHNGIIVTGTTASDNVVQGNYIGLDATGMNGLANGGDGVFVSDCTNNTIGGTASGAGNVISANGQHGINIRYNSKPTGGVVVQGNLIGTNADGTAALGNASRGIFIDRAPGNTIGGPVPGARNVISGNEHGIVFSSSTSGDQVARDNVVQGNFIGTDVSGTIALGNTQKGIWLFGSNNTIGGTIENEGNVIAFNGGDGVQVGGTDQWVSSNSIFANGGIGVRVAGGLGNAVLSNSISGNGGLGIDLGWPDTGVTPNDPGDPDTGPNNLQNYPDLDRTSHGNRKIMGALNSIADTDFKVEFFLNEAIDASGYGEGEVLLGTTMVRTGDNGDGSGDVAFEYRFDAEIPPGRFISATATDEGNSTSEFSLCVESPIVDTDGDGIHDEVDTDPLSFSDDINDNAALPDRETTGVVTKRGDHELDIFVSDVSSPYDGVVIAAEPLGGPGETEIVMCDGSVIIPVPDVPFEVPMKCGSVDLLVTMGTVVPIFVAHDNRTATATINEGNALYFDPMTFSFMAPATNTETIVLVINGDEIPLAPGDVLDNEPPVITIELNRDVLWPPNHKMANIIATVTVEDNNSENPTVRMDTIYSNEPDNGEGDGNTVNDIQDADFGSMDTQFRLRSERIGLGDGRVYTIVYRAVDEAGNEATETAYVRVPHDQSGHALSSMGFAASGMELDPELRQFALVIPSTEGFDATALDVTKTYVGNLKGVAVPERSSHIDNDADGLTDLVVFYSARVLSVMGDGGPIGLHYASGDGVDHLVPNIFELGEPVPVVPEVVIPRTNEGGDEGQSDGNLNEIPSVTALLPSYPNPFNPSTTIPFSLVSQERVTLRIYNAQGALLRTLNNETFPAGSHRVIWNGRDNNSQNVATGVYFVRFIAGNVKTTRKVVLIR